ncbi:hypothetical protein B0O99DRAFT_673432 [Bisporella sp. PMI_857]|nr:hypothetical protein B0O99DRAFT_673432 [Bisporella sp. PMI_857]
MADDFPSSNPFRRKNPAAGGHAATDQAQQPPLPAIHNHSAYEQTNIPSHIQPQHVSDPSFVSTSSAPPKKAAKKVRVQSPPPPSPSTASIPDSSSSTVEDNISTKLPIPSIQDGNPFNVAVPNVSQYEPMPPSKPAPANPFSRTLETMEHPDREGPVSPGAAKPGRVSMDVDAFKRLLMTGNAGLGTPSPLPASPGHLHTGGDGSSSTDASSISRHSMFESIQEAHNETPRTSHEVSEPDDESHGIAVEHGSIAAGRKKPPPPNSRHGKLIRIEPRDGASSAVPIASPEPPTPSSVSSRQYFPSSPTSNRSPTDLNKPLPPAPSRASLESDRESIFDKESAGKTPEPLSPPASQKRKTPPAPPLSRRHSHLASEPRIHREPGRLSPKAEEEGNSGTVDVELSRRSFVITELNRPSSSSGKAPPPPPTRKVGSVRRVERPHQNPLNSPSTVSLPPPTPPPVRGGSRSISGDRPASVLSFDLSTNKRSSMAPPPPPPRYGRNSMDGDSSRRTSGEARRPSAESVRSTRTQPEPHQQDVSGGKGILADLTRLQREIDALRIQSGRNEYQVMAFQGEV